MNAMKTFLMIVIALSCGFVLADARVELDNNGADTAHIPFNPANTDDEVKLSSITGSAIEYPSLGEYHIEVFGEFRNENWRVIPGLTPLNPVELNEEVTGENMNAVVDDNQFTCTTWDSMLRVSLSDPNTIDYKIVGSDCTKN